MADYIKLNKAPTLSFNNPNCEACAEEVESADEGWQCKYCGTYWSFRDGEDDPGELYESWSGESLEGEALDPDDWSAIFGRVMRLRQMRNDEV